MGSPCTSNATVWVESIGTGVLVKQSQIAELIAAINNEYDRRSNGNKITTTHIVGEVVKRSDFIEIIDKIDALQNYGWSSGVKTDILIKATHINEIRTNINDEEKVCICNCNYCTCDCNYCTCNCNYTCTCDCNYCACQCNYYCTCNCNYYSTYCTCNCNYIT